MWPHAVSGLFSEENGGDTGGPVETSRKMFLHPIPFAHVQRVMQLHLPYPGKYSPCGTVIAKTPNCTHECESGYPVSYKDDKHYAADNYSIPNDVKKIQTEIMTNGPVEATMDVFGDFMSYKSGISTVKPVYADDPKKQMTVRNMLMS